MRRRLPVTPSRSVGSTSRARRNIGITTVAEGEAKANRENARRMKTKGYPLEDIAEVTGLSPEEVERL